MSYNVSQQAYAPALGTTPTIGWHFDIRNPTQTDVTYPIGKVWANTSAQRIWYLNNFTSTSGIVQANWREFGTNGTATNLQGNSGGVIPPNNSGVIFVVGDGTTANVVGNAGTNTLTISASQTVPTTFTEDTGSAIPSSNNLNVFGGTGISTSGSGSTVTISTSSTVPTSFVEDSGTATPSAHTLNVKGGTAISTSGSSNTITINAAATIATTYTADSGSAVPAANNLNILGSGSTHTTGSGSTITITSTGGGLMWNEIIVTGPTTMSVDNGYVANNAGRVRLLLPATSVFGSILFIVGKGSGGWEIDQNAGQQIITNSSSTTVGATGKVQSSNQYDTIKLLCTVANTTWTVLNGTGNWVFT